MYCSNSCPGNPAAAPYPAPLPEDHGHGVDPRGLAATHRIFAGHSDSIRPGGHLGQLKINSLQYGTGPSFGPFLPTSSGIQRTFNLQTNFYLAAFLLFGLFHFYVSGILASVFLGGMGGSIVSSIAFDC